MLRSDGFGVTVEAHSSASHALLAAWFNFASGNSQFQIQKVSLR
jgi:hypothetical protein